MTDRRLPSKIMAKNKQNRFIVWGVLLALLSAVVAYFSFYLYDQKPANKQAEQAEVQTNYAEDPVYDLDNIEGLEEDVIASQAFDDSELVQIFKQQQATSKPSVQENKPTWLKNATPWPHRLNKPMVAVVINSVDKAKRAEWRQLKDYDIPLTYTISTDDKHYRKLAKLAHKKGREVIAHIPMEPLYPNKLPKELKGKKWLKANDSENTIKERVGAIIKETPYVVGVSNQMGSAFTSNAGAIEKLLGYLKGQGYMFLDSMTTKDSKALDVARDLRSPYLRRHLSFSFKDKKSDITEVADRVLNKNKYLVVFVSPDAKALKETLNWVQKKQQEGVAFVPLTAIMRRSIVQQKMPLNIDRKSRVFLKSPGLV